jgi:uncharacterized protein YbjT (DUF2867 family)
LSPRAINDVARGDVGADRAVATAGLVVPALVSHGIDVRAVVHEPGKKHLPLERGAGETVDADLRDPASLRAALDGADGVFLITPAFAPDATEMGLNLVEAAQAVYHPSLGLANHASTRPIEAALYASALDFTILQPAMYMQALDVTFSARAIDHPGGPGQLPVGPHPSIREETACPAIPRPSRPTTCHAS